MTKITIEKEAKFLEVYLDENLDSGRKFEENKKIIYKKK